MLGAAHGFCTNELMHLLSFCLTPEQITSPLIKFVPLCLGSLAFLVSLYFHCSRYNGVAYTPMFQGDHHSYWYDMDC